MEKPWINLSAEDDRKLSNDQRVDENGGKYVKDE